MWTEDEQTELWLTSCLLPDLNDQHDADKSSTHVMSPWWSRPAQQSDLGILLEVRDEETMSEGSGAVITEFLIYAAVLKSTDAPSYLPSPPASSSPLRTNGSDESSHGALVQNIRIRAVPLASTAYQGDYVDHSIKPNTNHDSKNDEAYFFPTIPRPTPAVPNSPLKRQRLLHLFEDATYQRKQLRRRGGEGVSKAMARLDSPTLHLESQRASNVEGPTPDSQVHLNARKKFREKGLSRSSSTPSTSQIDPSWLNSMTLHNGIDIQSSVRGGESVGALEQIPTIPTDINSFEDQNKSALTRIIMAGMRIYGLQQRRKSVKLQTDFELGADSTSTDKSVTRGDDEYKMVYHQTLKAATFTFRNQMSKEIINQATMGDVVDQLLALFCTDPLAVQETKVSFTSGSIENKGE